MYPMKPKTLFALFMTISTMIFIQAAIFTNNVKFQNRMVIESVIFGIIAIFAWIAVAD